MNNGIYCAIVCGCCLQENLNTNGNGYIIKLVGTKLIYDYVYFLCSNETIQLYMVSISSRANDIKEKKNTWENV